MSYFSVVLNSSTALLEIVSMNHNVYRTLRGVVFLTCLRLPCLDTTSFVPHLVERRDHGFHIYRQLCQYLFKLGRRCIKAKSLPQETDLSGILGVSVSDARALAVPDFIARSKLDQRLNTACKIKAEKELSDKKINRANLPKLVKESKEEFGRLGRSYVAYLFHAVQSNLQLTSDIVKGMGASTLTSCSDLRSVRLCIVSSSCFAASNCAVITRPMMSQSAPKNIYLFLTNCAKSSLIWTSPESSSLMQFPSFQAMSPCNRVRT